MKKLISITLAISLFLVAFAIPASAKEKSGKCGDNLTWKLDEATSTLTVSGTGEMYDYTYKCTTTMYGDLVESKEEFDSPFKYLRYKNLVIDEGVTSVGRYAFFRDEVENIYLPSTLTKIGKYAFYMINNIEKISVGENNKYFSTVDDVLFNKKQTKLILCPAAKSGEYSIPDTVTAIASNAFYNCSKLTNVILPDSIKSIGDNAFSMYYNINLDTFKLPKNLETLGKNALGSLKYKKIIINENLKSLDYSSIDNSELKTIKVDKNNKHFSSKGGVLFNKKQTSLILYPKKKTGKYTVPKTVKTIKNHAFNGSSLKKIKLTSVKTIEKSAFSGMKAQSIDLGKKLKTINNKAFSGSSFKSITIPKSVKTIGKETFVGCNALKKVCFLTTKKLPKIKARAFLTSRPPLTQNKITFIVKNEKIKKSLLKKLEKGLGIKKYTVKVK